MSGLIENLGQKVTALVKQAAGDVCGADPTDAAIWPTVKRKIDAADPDVLATVIGILAREGYIVGSNPVLDTDDDNTRNSIVTIYLFTKWLENNSSPSDSPTLVKRRHEFEMAREILCYELAERSGFDYKKPEGKDGFDMLNLMRKLAGDRIGSPPLN